MYYELLRTDTCNVVGDYDTIEAAYAVVCLAADDDADRALVLTLACATEDGELEEIASGADLIRHARGAVPA